MRRFIVISLLCTAGLVSCGSDEGGDSGASGSGGLGGTGASGGAGGSSGGVTGGSAGAAGATGGAGGSGATGGTGGAGGTGGSGGAGGTGGASGGGSAGSGATGGTAGATGGTGGGASVPSGTFLADQDDHIVFEIESVADDSPPDPWAYGTTGPCADPSACEPLGSGYYQFKGANQCGQVNSGGTGVMSVNFEVKTAGRYRVVWRNLRDHRDGDCTDDRNNDSFMAFPTTNSDNKFTTPIKVYGGGSGTWNWSATYDINNEKEKVCVEFDAGIHPMEIHGRSHDHAIDKVALFRVDGTLADCRSAGTAGLDAYPETGIAP